MDQLRTEANRPSFKKRVFERHGDRCVNCGGTGGVELHHIVPLFCGGTNNIGNVVPLCWPCHRAAHHGRHVQKYKRKPERVGRRRKNELNPKTSEVFWEYAKGEITTTEAKEKLGVTKSTKITDMAVFKEWKKKNGIKRTHNTKAVANCNGYVTWQNKVAEIEYEDGRLEVYERNGRVRA